MAIRFAGYNRNKVYSGPTSKTGLFGVMGDKVYANYGTAPGLTTREYRRLKEYGWKRGDPTALGGTLVAPEGKSFPGDLSNKVVYRPKKRDVNKKALAGG